MIKKYNKSKLFESSAADVDMMIFVDMYHVKCYMLYDKIMKYGGMMCRL